MATSRRLAAILAADIADYSRLMGADDVATVHDLKQHQAVVLPMVAEYAGRVIDTAGDGVLAEFASVVDAVNCAIAMQREMAARGANGPPERAMRFRMAVNLGDVVADEARIYGDGINVAARLEALAQPGGLCISGKVYDEVQDKVDASFEFVGNRSLKNIVRPVPIWRWVIQGASADVATHARQTGPLSIPEKPSIAVLPFANMSGDLEQEYFADGICEDLITSLSSMRWFFVIARNTTFTYKGKAVGVKQVATELGVRFVVEGSVRRAGGRVRINVQLIDGQTGNHVWAERYDRNLTDIFDLQDEIVRSVGSAIEPQLLEFESRRAQGRSVDDLGAWDLMIRARGHYWKMTPSETGIAIDILRDLVARYPNYGPAHSLFAFALLFNRHMGWIPPGDVIDIATTLARRAAEIDDLDPWVHVSLGYLAVARRDTDRASQCFDRAIALNPNFAAAFGWRGLAFSFGGRSDRAIQDLEKSIRLSPQDTQNAIFVAAIGIAHYLAGRYELAVRYAEETVQMRPNFVAAYRIYSAALARLGRFAEARTMLDRVLLLQPNATINLLRETVPYAQTADMDHFLGGMRLAGLPES